MERLATIGGGIAAIVVPLALVFWTLVERDAASEERMQAAILALRAEVADEFRLIRERRREEDRQIRDAILRLENRFNDARNTLLDTASRVNERGRLLDRFIDQEFKACE